MQKYGPGEAAQARTQRDNGPDRAKQCNVTAGTIMLDGSGYELPDKGPQPEVALARFAETDPRVAEYMRKRQRWAVDLGWPPYSESNTLAYAMNLWLGRDGERGPVRYSPSRTLEQIAADLTRARCSVLLGRFTPGGHYICLVQVWSEQWFGGPVEAREVDLARVDRWMAHDPWGNWHTGYRDQNGAGELYTTDELMRLGIAEGQNAKQVLHLVDA